MDYINNRYLEKSQESYLESLLSSMRKLMSRDLYLHTTGTLKFSAKLSDKYIFGKEINKSNIDTFLKLCISSILHDYGKIFKYEELKNIAVKNNLGLSEFEIGCRPILHSFVGDYLVARDYNIRDTEILKIIKYHTIGYCDMSLWHKILFISDKIEETRNYGSVDDLRKLSFKSLDLCLLEVYKNNIIYNVNKNNLLHPKTSVIWNNICGGK
ncbi:MAG: bis(5'-nucleosyl)-tetraphosphatase (symmetrical) YqeK [Actinomycetota bacterium]